jgi:hypothetical protein
MINKMQMQNNAHIKEKTFFFFLVIIESSMIFTAITLLLTCFSYSKSISMAISLGISFLFITFSYLIGFKKYFYNSKFERTDHPIASAIQTDNEVMTLDELWGEITVKIYKLFSRRKHISSIYTLNSESIYYMEVETEPQKKEEETQTDEDIASQDEKENSKYDV